MARRLFALQERVGNRAVSRILDAGLGMQRRGEGTGEATHDTMLRRGDRGEDVERLQRLINDYSVRGMLVVDGIFGRRTQHYVRAIQQRADLPETGVATPETWRAIRGGAAPGDLLSGISMGGEDEEVVGGIRYVGDHGYAMEVTDRQVRITVGIDFVGASAGGVIHRWIQGIARVWNRFAARDALTGRELPLIFEPDTGGSAHHRVTVHRGPGRSDEANWFTGDPEPEKLAAHEFGHMIGLDDEYQRGHEDFQRVTGAGEVEGDPGMPYGLEPAEVADEILVAHGSSGTPLQRIAAIQAVLDRWHVTEQGRYAAAVAAAYEQGAGHPLLDDLVALDQSAPSASRGAYDLIEIFTYSSETIMGNMGMDHEHAARARHVRGFVDYVGDVVGGGPWEPTAR